MRIRALATLATVLLMSLAGTAAASPPAAASLPTSDRQPDAVGDVVRTHADGHTSTGFGRSDMRWVRMDNTRIGGRDKAVDVVVHLTEVDQRMLRNHVRLTVRFVSGTGHVGRTVTKFDGGTHGATTTVEGFGAENCIPYPRHAGARDNIAISLTHVCWPRAKTVRAKVWVRYNFTPNGRARDIGQAGPIAIH